MLNMLNFVVINVKLNMFRDILESINESAKYKKEGNQIHI